MAEKNISADDENDTQNEGTSKHSTGEDESKKNKKPKYPKNRPRITKDTLYMIIALWMEDFVDTTTTSDEEIPYNKAGAVMVLPDDKICAVDCSRARAHAAARLLITHHDKAKGSRVYMSRKPCSLCSKYLVQSKVERVLFLPFEPECYYRPDLHDETLDETKLEKIEKRNETQIKEVDNLFRASSIAQTKFILEVDKSAFERKKDDTPDEDKQKVTKEIDELRKKYKAFYKWTLIEPDKPSLIEKKLPWPEFDKHMGKEVVENFDDVMDWIARVLVRQGRRSRYDFELISPEASAFDPVNNDISKKQAKHFITIAHFLAERTDDPKTGVGAVIVNPKMKFISLGWNGFPLKAEYGEFARASKDDDPTDKKYPYVIHAEQNALLMRNQQDIEGSILFVTKCPCNECTPLIEMAGIKTVVVDDDVSLRADEKAVENTLDYKLFPRKVIKGDFVCYQTKKLQEGPPPGKAREIDFEQS